MRVSRHRSTAATGGERNAGPKLKLSPIGLEYKLNTPGSQIRPARRGGADFRGGLAAILSASSVPAQWERSHTPCAATAPCPTDVRRIDEIPLDADVRGVDHGRRGRVRRDGPAGPGPGRHTDLR